MYDTARIRICKWTGFALGVLFLSQTIARWKDFFSLPGLASYAAVMVAVTVFAVLLASLALVVYAEEKAKGNIKAPMPFFERWTDRFFLKS
jgi:hypothetical protein